VADPNEGSPFARFIVNAPMYQKQEILGLKPFKPPIPVHEFEKSITLPKTIKRECGTCGGVPNWEYPYEDRAIPELERIPAIYLCKSCGDAFGVWIQWVEENGKVICEKFGEFPKPEARLPKELETALRQHAEFWRKGMTMRHHNYGLGALVCFRRIVEDATGDLLELLAKAMESAKQPQAEVEAVRRLIGERAPFEDKMKLASEMIPAVLRPGGANPFNTIFAVVSAGMHGKTDSECSDLVDALADAMAVLVARLNQEIDSAKKLADAVKKIEGLGRP